jgi:adenosine deaminase
VIEELGRLRKIELHLHLEGSIPLPALWTLVEKYGAASKVGSLEVLQERFQYRDFPHFIQAWIWKNQFLREYEDFTFIAAEVAQSLSQQNICYAEAFFSPGDFSGSGLQAGRLAEAIRKGLDRFSHEVEVNLVADLIRDLGPENGMRCLHDVAEARDAGVLGVGIGGSEQDFPPDPYADVYEEARKLGFRTSAHAGEAAGPESIWAAIQKLRVDRIGHATHAIRDPDLIRLLKRDQVPLEVCPISNLRTGVVAKASEHPIHRFYREGLRVTVSTDDPAMFNNSLVDEYLLLIDTFGFSFEDIVQLNRNAVHSAWCGESRKRELLELVELSARPCSGEG